MRIAAGPTDFDVFNSLFGNVEWREKVTALPLNKMGQVHPLRKEIRIGNCPQLIGYLLHFKVAGDLRAPTR